MVDLPRRQTLAKDNGDWPAYGLRGLVKSMANVIGEDRQPRPLPRTIRIVVDDVPDYPWFLRFRNVRDPVTVEEVDSDDLARSFGPASRCVR